ncbi:TetR/AcrR family transcriptional regulator [Aquisalibacillus elongatus]|uniref:TetR family transcriptional regulator n=1 Tax=Aquisalibacillus elongatus TaxID=485577 RepID=A0A3N5BCQ3_9BACI|nr:TetR/AcrR family transcriptional regulator [Aquisalibacillus elongatus]RPF55486.1 TetR family transcriptional regulator [Aquisalibacillus elongatus]
MLKISPRKPVDQQLERKDILDTARELFVSEGYRGVSMRLIASSLKVSHGAIYYHFKNKASLFYAIVTEGFLSLDKELENTMAMELNNETKLREVFIAYMKFGINYSNYYEIMFLIKDDELNTLIHQEPNQSYENFAKAVYQLCDPQKVNLQRIWSIFLSLHGFVTHYIKSGQSFDEIEGLVNSHADFLIKSLEL